MTTNRFMNADTYVNEIYEYFFILSPDVISAPRSQDTVLSNSVPYINNFNYKSGELSL